MVENRLFPVRPFRHTKMFTDRDSKDDKESLTQRALRLEERNARAASASMAEGELESSDSGCDRSLTVGDRGGSVGKWPMCTDCRPIWNTTILPGSGMGYSNRNPCSFVITNLLGVR